MCTRFHSGCNTRNKNARVARASARYARRAGPPFSLNILRPILRGFGTTVFLFFMSGHCIPRTKDMKVAVTTRRKSNAEKRGRTVCAAIQEKRGSLSRTPGNP